MSNTEPKTCPKCQSPMEEGFLRDWGAGATFPGEWVEGKPQQGWLSPAVRVSGKAQRTIEAHRCTKCFYLELYAPPEES